ncbi:hypothetical protein D3C79_457710 [compost metagenome]
MPGGGIEQRRVAPHIRVVAQPGAGPLRLGDPGLPGTVDYPKAHQFTAVLGQAVKNRLDDVGTVAGEVTKAQRYQLGRQLIAAVFPVLAHVAQPHQLREHAVGSAFGNVQALGQGL